MSPNLTLVEKLMKHWNRNVLFHSTALQALLMHLVGRHREGSRVFTENLTVRIDSTTKHAVEKQCRDAWGCPQRMGEETRYWRI